MSLRALYDLPAPAKLNMFLHVVGRRADGYHLLQSPFVMIDWADVLHVERRDDGHLQRHDLGPALPADDLCLRAARALQTASGCTLGADIHIHVRKGQGRPAYSIFEGVADDGSTMSETLDRLAVTDLDVAGIATDHCVLASALDALQDGRSVTVLTDLIAGVGIESSAAALARLDAAGARLAPSLPS